MSTPFASAGDLLSQYQLSDEERKRLMLGNLLLGLGGGLMSNNRRGNALGAAGSGAVQGAMLGQSAIADARRGKMDEFKMWLGAQEYDQKNAAAQLAAQQQAEAQKALGGIFGGAPRLQNMGEGGPTPANAAAVAPPSKLDQYRQAAAWYAAKGDAAKAKTYSEIADKMEEEFSTTPQVGMINGQPINALISKRGTVKELPQLAPPPKFREVNLGGSTQILNDYQLPASGMSLAHTLSPEGVQTGQLGWANYGLSKAANDRAAAAAANPQPSFHEGQYVYPPTAPGGARAELVPGYQHPEKPLTAEQGQAAMYLGMMRTASADIDKIKQPPVGEIALARGDVSYIPKAVQNWVATPDAQKYAQSALQWTEAMLRITTGATAPPEEVARTSKTFFPQIGDSDAVVKQKNAKRTQMEEFVRIKAGRGGAGQVDATINNTLDFSQLPK